MKLKIVLFGTIGIMLFTLGLLVLNQSLKSRP